MTGNTSRSSSASPLLVEIIAYAPTAFYHCTHCEVAWRAAGVGNQMRDEQVHNSLPPDLAADYQLVSDWVRDIFRLYTDRIVVKVIDAASLEGFYKSLRYGVRRYPGVIVDRSAHFGRARFVGNPRQALPAAADEIERRLRIAPAAGV